MRRRGFLSDRTYLLFSFWLPLLVNYAARSFPSEACRLPGYGEYLCKLPGYMAEATAFSDEYIVWVVLSYALLWGKDANALKSWLWGGILTFPLFLAVAGEMGTLMHIQMHANRAAHFALNAPLMAVPIAMGVCLAHVVLIFLLRALLAMLRIVHIEPTVKGI